MKDGWLIVVDGVAIDYDIVEKYIIDTAEKYDLHIKEIDYDGWNATQFALRLSKKGFECVEIRQGYHTLSEPTKNFRECAYKGTVIHNNNPVLSWCVSNAVAVQDSAANIKVDKARSGEKIDLLVAAIIAHVRAYLDFDSIDYKGIMNDYLEKMGW